MTSPDAAVAVRGLVKTYRGRRPVAAVVGLDLTAPGGALTALLGPNGAGKTTTVECCEGLRRPDGGSVRVLGLDPVREARALRPRVGVMLQDGGLPTTVPAGEVLTHVARLYGAVGAVRPLSERLGIDAFARTTVRRLSGGQRQRLALAAAVVGGRDLVFLDEPTAGLDPQARLAVWDLVRELRADGTSIVLTTHQMADAEALADHVVVVDQGRTLVSGSVENLVGSGTGLRVRLAGTGDLARTRASLASHLAEGEQPGPPVTATDGELVVDVTPDAALLHRVTGWALETGTEVTALTTGRRTLEDVFLELTGRSLR